MALTFALAPWFGVGRDQEGAPSIDTSNNQINVVTMSRVVIFCGFSLALVMGFMADLAYAK